MIDTVNSPYIHAATSHDFEQIVIENSDKGPVLVNFWSKKAGPCLRQYPILDQLVHKHNGLLLLVNVDSDKEVMISKDYGVASVPTLKLFRNGKVLETLHGYQSEEGLDKMLEQHLRRDSDKVLSDAILLYANGEQKQAYEKITSAIIDDPVNPRLPLTICKLLKHEKRYDEAIYLLDSLPPDIKEYHDIKPLNAEIFFLAQQDASENIDNLLLRMEDSPHNPAIKQQLAVQYVLAEQPEKALQLLEQIMDQDLHYDDNFVQKSMLNLFTLLGEGHPLIKAYQPGLRRYTH